MAGCFYHLSIYANVIVPTGGLARGEGLGEGTDVMDVTAGSRQGLDGRAQQVKVNVGQHPGMLPAGLTSLLDSCGSL